MNDRATRHHYAFTLKRVKGGYEVGNVTELPTRGQADKHALTLLGRYGGDTDALTLERELANGEVLSADLVKR